MTGQKKSASRVIAFFSTRFCFSRSRCKNQSKIYKRHNCESSSICFLNARTFYRIKWRDLIQRDLSLIGNDKREIVTSRVSLAQCGKIASLRVTSRRICFAERESDTVSPFRFWKILRHIYIRIHIYIFSIYTENKKKKISAMCELVK